jgi:hypothetical protein
LEPKPGSLYRQPFIKGTRIRAEIPFGHTVTKEDEEGIELGLSPEQVAEFLHVPLAAVLEAIDWCQANWAVVVADHAREDRLSEASGMNHPEYKISPAQHYKPLSPQAHVRIANDEDLPR